MKWKNAKGGFVYWLNRLMNPNHAWTDYYDPTTGEDVSKNDMPSLKDDDPTYGFTFGNKSNNSIFGNLFSGLNTFLDAIIQPGSINDLVKTWTGSGLTTSQIQANEMSMQNQEDIYQRQVAGMQKAGLNPALMYQNGGASNAPAIQGQQGNSNMSDLMSVLLLKKQSTLLDAQARKTDAETDKIGAETEYQKLVNEFYPDVTATQVDKMLMDMGVSETQIEKMKSEIDVNRLEAALKETQNIIEKAKANESSAYYKAIREFAEADTAKAKEEKKEIAVRAAMEELERGFMDKYGAKMGSSEYIAIASAVAGLFGIDLNVFSKSPIRGLLESLGLIGNEKPSGAAKGGGSR